MPSFLSASFSSFDDSTIHAVLAAVVVLALQPLLSISSPFFSHYPRLHLQRRIQHVVTNLLLTWLATASNLFSRFSVLLILSGCAVLLFCLQLLRRYDAVNTAFVRACGSLLRPHELHGLPAGYWNLLGVLLCVGMNEVASTAFPISIVRLSLLYEAVGDPMAAIIGTSLSPSVASGGKTVAGSIGMMLTCSAVTAVYLVATHSPFHLSWLIVPPAVCAMVERYTGRGRGWLPLDDNLTVPLITCIIVSLLQSAHVLPAL